MRELFEKGWALVTTSPATFVIGLVLGFILCNLL